MADQFIQVRDARGTWINGVLITASGDPNPRLTDGSGFVHFPVAEGVTTFTFEHDGYVTRIVNLDPANGLVIVDLEPTFAPPPFCMGVTLDGRADAIVGVLVTQVETGDTRLSDGNGFWHFGAGGDFTYRFEQAGWETTERALPRWDFQHRVHLTRAVVAPPPPPEPGVHPDPWRGRVRCDGISFSDNNGRRLGIIAHMGDLFARLAWGRHTGNQALVDEVQQDVFDARDAGYTFIRFWTVLNWWLRPGNPWFGSRYPGVSEQVPGFVDSLAWALSFIADNGMRSWVCGGVADGTNTEDERRQFDAIERAIRIAGADTVGSLEGANEITSAGCADRDGDEHPDHLRALLRRVTDHHDVLWHLSHASSLVWDNPGDWTSQKRYTHVEQMYGAYHPDRGGDGADKIRREFSWRLEAPGLFKRLWVSQESNGAKTVPEVPGDPLSRVSATASGHEMENAGLLANLAAIAALRGWPSHMSGNGVRRFKRFTETVGWREIPWVVSQLPRDLHTFGAIVHGGRPNAILRATTNRNGVLLRVDSVQHADGRVVAVAYSDKAHEDHEVEAAAGVELERIDAGPMTVSAPFRIGSGGRHPLGRLGGEYGTVLRGRRV